MLLRPRVEVPELVCEECGGEQISWSEFVEGVAELMSCNCCGGALAGATAAALRPKPAALRDPTPRPPSSLHCVSLTFCPT